MMHTKGIAITAIIIIVVVAILIIGFSIKQKQQPIECTFLKQNFDDSIKKLYLPADGSNPDFFCTGLNFSSDFSKLKPKWAIAKLEKKEIEENTLILTFKGVNETEKWFTDKKDNSKYQEGDYYQIDMYNFCRRFISILSSNTDTSSKIDSTIIEPKKVRCE